MSCSPCPPPSRLFSLAPSSTPRRRANAHITVQGIGMQQHEHSPQSIHGVPAGFVVEVIEGEGFMFVGLKTLVMLALAF